MAKTIHKYHIDAARGIAAISTIEMPRGAHILSADSEGSAFVVWAHIDQNAPFVNRHVYIAPTGTVTPEFLGRVPALIGRIDARPVSTNSNYILRFHAFDFGETPL
ncbi:hypothetical protein BcepF1.069 [Burkholderia phage BcepF1]|uniref:DUF7352 domain-containing protein n=1 Tax=Burkholderia phage BcepF1 TaxID=2886897 RepID=A1YZX3_9CAUD|nr:hypothetical protein BcepF1.069 [Burkholderia phage BcepF1]ABL96800.1 hypothetical protein BcepF1.069 [Burkholderia phage BcepF1]